MRRFLTLVCLLGLALPAGISISGCTRNPQGNYCNGLGYGPKDTDVTSIILQPQVAGISLAYGQTTQIQSPSAYTCKNNAASIGSNAVSYATTNNQLVDISPGGQICAGTWNRNTGGGIADYTNCYYPNPLPSTGGLPYSVAYITATAYSVTSNPVAVYIHAPVTAISLATTSLSSSSSQQCFSQNQQVQLDAQACYVSNGIQYELCAPASITSNFACTGGAQPSPNIIASAAFNAPSVGPNGSIAGSLYISGGTITGSLGQTCNVSNFNNGATGATATLQMTAQNTAASGNTLTVAAGTPLIMTSGGTGAAAPPTQATLSNGTATCSGTIQIGQIYGTAGQSCYLTSFNNGSSGAQATLSLSGPNTIGSISVTNGGVGATAPPTLAAMSSGTANCAGAASVTTTLTPVPSCGSSIGTLNYSVSNSSVATFNSTTNVITAQQPGTTSITATISQSSSSAGYFSTCPAASIKVALAGGGTKGVVTQGVSQNLTAAVLDTLGNPINGLNLSYESTNPVDITVSSGGAITAAFPGVASIYAVCEPSSCNPAPINEFGLNGNGLSLSSNPVGITVPGTTSDFVWFGAPGQSQYFSSIELLTGNPGSTVRLPFVPNSMVMDQAGNNLYFGSPRELMIYSTAGNSLNKQDTSAPGIVLAVAPNNNQLVINDQVRGLFYLYNTSSGPTASFGGLGVAAAWTPDSNTLYIVDSAAANNLPQNIAAGITTHTDKLYVYNVNTGWYTSMLACSTSNTSSSICNSALGTNLSAGATNVAITVPGIGAYLAGNPTVAHTWCPSGTVGNNASIQFYPQSDSVSVLTDVLGATSDGAHMLGASLSGSSITLDDIGLSIPPNSTNLSAQCPETTTGTPPNQVETMTPLSTNPTLNGTSNLNPGTGVTVSAVNQVVTGAAPTTASTTTAAPIAFITYTTPSTSAAAAQLPYYLPQASGMGPVGYVKFADAASATPPTAPLTGTFSPDNTIFFVSTAGDNLIHFISIPTNVSTSAPPTDSQQYSPNLPACTPGGIDAGCLYPTTPGASTVVPATVIAVKPRSVT
jgi:hypothetical protein